MDIAYQPKRIQTRKQPFRFKDLPAEIRLRIYEFALSVRKPVDLAGLNQTRIAPLLRLFLTSRQIYDEAYRVFYAVNTFRIFSCDGKFFNHRRQLLSRFTPSHQACLTSIELRLGPGWTKPPKHWVLTSRMGLEKCTALKQLKVFAELDPENSEICKQWMKNHQSYTVFGKDLMVKILTTAPNITEVWFDGFPSVLKDGPLVSALLAEANRLGKRITFGPLRGWAKPRAHRELDLEAIVRQTSSLALTHVAVF
ncbi:hypothetical protein FKW77_004193 [Venturia effusa]|uniref:F-box domain-containing protein n=1 Tax=Venturia effusa TaxID=50376 RepID=A0A517L357_9PEZI|nr:hypothetical protein FKW77_004193 [Venturia effusa]